MSWVRSSHAMKMEQLSVASYFLPGFGRPGYAHPFIWKGKGLLDRCDVEWNPQATSLVSTRRLATMMGAEDEPRPIFPAICFVPHSSHELPLLHSPVPLNELLCRIVAGGASSPKEGVQPADSSPNLLNMEMPPFVWHIVPSNKKRLPAASAYSPYSNLLHFPHPTPDVTSRPKGMRQN